VAEDFAATRATLLSAFRSGQGATEFLAADAVRVLGATWPTPTRVIDVATDELLAEVLQSSPVFPVWLERMMTAARRSLLFSAPNEAFAPLRSWIAIQCHLNEHAWAEDATETRLVEILAASLQDLTPEQVMSLASYRPLARLPGADSLLDKGWTGPVEKVLREHIVAVREEQAIADALPTLTPISGAVSEAVRSQYEAHPYPRWRRAGPGAVQTQVNGRRLPKDPTIFIAGCGTGRQAILATMMLEARHTLAVDLSRTSLAYAVRKSRELGIADRITYAQADLLELGDSVGPFDIVQSAGVLHHLHDPFEGARKVCRLAKPGGFVALGLYSARAREHLKPGKALGKSYTPDTVREFRQDIIARPLNDPVRIPAVASRDFYATSGCRDLLMHVQEHELNFDDLRRMLRENDLTFLGFLQFSFQEIRDAYLARFPHDPQGLDLDAWEAFEADNPATFRRMYQFWAQKAA
jgi:SAM-dependent methyltransferase